MTVQTPVPRNATGLVELCENHLGWDPYEQTKGGTVPVWKVKAIEAGKINAAMKRSPKRCTLENLTIALDYCRREKINIMSPFGLVAMLSDALKAHQQPEVVTDLETAIEEALAQEQAAGDPDGWGGRFIRAVGPARLAVYEEWKASRER